MQVPGLFKSIIIELAHIPIKDKKLNKTPVGAHVWLYNFFVVLENVCDQLFSVGSFCQSLTEKKNSIHADTFCCQ